MDDLIRADFTVRASAHPIIDGPEVGSDWHASPLAGVERFPLDRVGGEVARATSLVRYAPGSVFSSHNHDLGEEYLVLEGTFGDEHGRYPEGSYVRNPPGSEHSPDCPDGCVIFVKLRQMDTAESDRLVVEPSDESRVLFESDTERVELVQLTDGEARQVASSGELPGCEMLVVKGAVEVDGERFARWAWARLPEGELVSVMAKEPATIWIKTGGVRA